MLESNLREPNEKRRRSSARNPRRTLDEEPELTYEQAFTCVQRIFEKLNEKWMTKEQFKKLCAKLDDDGSGKITENEMKTFVHECLDRTETLLVSIVWVGHVL